MRLARTSVVLAFVLVPDGSASADSEMHQSPLLERGTAAGCADLQGGRRQRGAYAWQFDCAGVPRSEGPGGRRGR